MASIVPLPKPAVAPVSIVLQSFFLPTGVTGQPGESRKATDTRYESNVSVSGGLRGRFRGSIYPDNMNIKGRVLNGTYNVYLGFHHVGVPTEPDLVSRTNGFRAVLVVNQGYPLRVESNSPTKTSSEGIHIHNGFKTWVPERPMSEGCLIIHPSDWSDFISLFLKAFPDLSDWHTKGWRVGRKVGTVTVQAITPMGDFPTRSGTTAFA